MAKDIRESLPQPAERAHMTPSDRRAVHREVDELRDREEPERRGDDVDALPQIELIESEPECRGTGRLPNGRQQEPKARDDETLDRRAPGEARDERDADDREHEELGRSERAQERLDDRDRDHETDRADDRADERTEQGRAQRSSGLSLFGHRM